MPCLKDRFIKPCWLVYPFGTVSSSLSNIGPFSWWLGSVVSFVMCMFTSSSWVHALAFGWMVDWFKRMERLALCVHCFRGLASVMDSVSCDVSSEWSRVREAMKVSIGSLSWDNFWAPLPKCLESVMPSQLSIVGFVLAIQFAVGVIPANSSKWAPLLVSGMVSLSFASDNMHLDPESG